MEVPALRIRMVFTLHLHGESSSALSPSSRLWFSVLGSSQEEPSEGWQAMTETGIQMLKMFEGLRLEPYLDAAGKGTIGWGHLILPGEKFDGPITEEQAEELLLADIVKHEHGLLSLIDPVDLVRPFELDALVSLVFNIGGANFKRSTLLRWLNEGRTLAEVADQFPRWNKAGGKVLKGLTRRRCAEAACFLGAGPGLIQAIYGA